MKKWLYEALQALGKQTTNVDEFVEQSNSLNRVSEEFQDVRDLVDLFGLFYNVLHEFEIEYKKEDKDSHTEAVQDIQKLQAMITQVESSQNDNQEFFKKQLNDEIPKLNVEIDKLAIEADNDDFLSNKTSMYDNLRVLDDLEGRFKELEATSVKYNQYQEVLEVPGTQFENMETLREQL
jgi:hypothetical protein